MLQAGKLRRILVAKLRQGEGNIAFTSRNFGPLCKLNPDSMASRFIPLEVGRYGGTMRSGRELVESEQQHNKAARMSSGQ